jgi:site-specific DNA recombinase
VPALVRQDCFARAQELLQENKIRSRRRTIEPSVVQGLVSCQKCGYALSRTSTRTSARKIHYYKCIGSDGWRKLGGPICSNRRLIRQDLLDQIVWAEVIRLLEDPALIQQELDRRLAAARSSDPTAKREQSLQRELTHVGKGIDRLLNAYQEGLLSIEQLRERMPALRQHQQTLRAELQAIADQANDREAFLRLAETITAFLSRLRSAAETLSVTERQRIVRLVVKDILVGEDTITIRHSIPIPTGPPQNAGSQPPSNQNYLLCKGSDHRPLRSAYLGLRPLALLRHSRLQPFLDQAKNAMVGHAVPDTLHRPFVVHLVKEPTDVRIQHPVHPLPMEAHTQRIQRLVRAAPRPEPVRKAFEVHLVNFVENGHHGLLNDFVLQRRDAQRALPSVDLRYIDSSRGLRPVCTTVNPAV